MIDANWNENAKAAVREFADYIGQSDKCERYLEHIAPKKTVADAVEYYNGELPEGEAILGIAYSNNKIVPYYAGSPIADGTNSPDSYIICTREQFEAYVKEQESKQEGEKWTHETIIGSKCIIQKEKPDARGMVLVLLDNGNYHLHSESSLKPIKPKLTKAEAWDKIHLMQNVSILTDKYDII